MMFVIKKSRLIYMSTDYRKQWETPITKYANKSKPHKENTILIENLDEESTIETPSTLEEATLPKSNNILPPLESHPPSTPPIEISGASVSANTSEKKPRLLIASLSLSQNMLTKQSLTKNYFDGKSR